MKRKWNMFQIVREGSLLPRLYGIAWVDWQSNRAVCLPVPFNVVAGWARSAWHFIQHGGRNVRWDCRAAYQQGREDERRAHETFYEK